jgi:hypothetical protein
MSLAALEASVGAQTHICHGVTMSRCTNVVLSDTRHGEVPLLRDSLLFAQGLPPLPRPRMPTLAATQRPLLPSLASDQWRRPCRRPLTLLPRTRCTRNPAQLQGKSMGPLPFPRPCSLTCARRDARRDDACSSNLRLPSPYRPSSQDRCYGCYTCVTSASLAAPLQAKEPLLPSFDLAGVAALIKSGRAKRIICMCGAGISVSAGG